MEWLTKVTRPVRHWLIRHLAWGDGVVMNMQVSKADPNDPASPFLMTACRSGPHRQSTTYA